MMKQILAVCTGGGRKYVVTWLTDDRIPFWGVQQHDTPGMTFGHWFSPVRQHQGVILAIPAQICNLMVKQTQTAIQ